MSRWYHYENLNGRMVRLPKIEQPQCTSFRNGNDLRCLRRDGHDGDHGTHWYDGERRVDVTWPLAVTGAQAQP